MKLKTHRSLILMLSSHRVEGKEIYFLYNVMNKYTRNILINEWYKQFYEERKKYNQIHLES